jgi:Transglycosylase SLT domain
MGGVYWCFPSLFGREVEQLRCICPLCIKPHPSRAVVQVAAAMFVCVMEKDALEQSAAIWRSSVTCRRPAWLAAVSPRLVTLFGSLLFVVVEPQLGQASLQRHVVRAIDSVQDGGDAGNLLTVTWQGDGHANGKQPKKTLDIAKEDGANSPRLSRKLEGAIQNAAERYALPTATLRAFAAIESGGNPRATTGSYHGVFQLSRSEFEKYGGRGNIFDLDKNTDVAARKLRSESEAFSQQYGRAPTAVELYLVHQQGVSGAAMHLANPDVPAWQNMYHTGEGQKKGPGWARLAIWGNVPVDQRAQFPAGVGTITSRQFMEMWAQKMVRFGGSERKPSSGPSRRAS